MDEFDLYPKKPELIEQKQKSGLSLTVFSIVIFVLAFILVLGDEFNFIIYLLTVLLIHELGHFISMRLFKYKDVRMLFIPLMGAFVQGTKKKYSQKESFIVTGAGPFPGVLIGTFLVWYSTEIQSSWLMSLGMLFLLLNIINLLPLDPLDGGQLFKLFFKKQSELFLMIFAFVSSVVMILFGWFLDSYVIILFGFFMGFRVRALQKRYQVHRDLKDDEINYATTYKLLSNKDYVKIKQVVIEHTPALQKFIDNAPSSETDSVLASQVNNVLDTPLKKDASGLFKVLIFILWIASFLMPILMFYLVDLSWFMPIYEF